MRTLIFLTITLLSAKAIAQDTRKGDVQNTSRDLFVPQSDYEYIPGNSDYDLIQDRISCIEKDIPLNFNTRVHAFINYFAIKDRAYTKMIIQRRNVYFPLFEKYLKKYDLPDELKYLSIIESGLKPTAVSRARAVGLWQFMAFTGRQYGLHQDWYLDERMDPEKSTEAACKFLKQLYGMFGNWELAIAAYNTGPGNVRKAIRRSGYKRSFWEIYQHLYRETRSYLPQFVAMIYVMNYTEEHNFFESELEYAMDSDTIHIDSYLHFETLANQLNLCKNDLERLNPGLKRGVVPESSKNYRLKIPADIKPQLVANRQSILDSAAKVGKKEVEFLARNSPGSTYGRSKIVHRVRRGDVLGKIAQRYHVRIADIKKWNNLRGNTIRVGQRLSIWQRSGYQNSVASSKPKPQIVIADGSQTYIVQPGDTLWDISRMFKGMSIQKLKQMNKLSSNKIKPGQRLIVGS